MLVIHLSTLVIINYLPGGTEGVAFKKVCLRQENKAGVVWQKAEKSKNKKLLVLNIDKPEKPARKAEVKICSVKLFCTVTTQTAALATHRFLYQEPGFTPVTYYSHPGEYDPEPPRFA